MNVILLKGFNGDPGRILMKMEPECLRSGTRKNKKEQFLGIYIYSNHDLENHGNTMNYKFSN